MQKTFLKFVVFELVERIARFRLLLNECADTLHESAPVLKQSLGKEADELEAQLLSHKTLLNKLFSETGGKQADVDITPVIAGIHGRLRELSKVLLHLNQLELPP